MCGRGRVLAAPFRGTFCRKIRRDWKTREGVPSRVDFSWSRWVKASCESSSQLTCELGSGRSKKNSVESRPLAVDSETVFPAPCCSSPRHYCGERGTTPKRQGQDGSGDTSFRMARPSVPESPGLSAPDHPPSGRLDDDPALRPDRPGGDAWRRRSGEERLRLPSQFSRRVACLRGGNALGRRPHIWSYRSIGSVARVCREGPGLMRRCD